MANLSKSKQLLVRTALVTASTVATLIGAQTLALTNLHPAATPAQSSDTAQTVLTSLTTTTTITHAAPTIIVLSGGNQQIVNSQGTTNPVIAPPVPQVNQATSQISQSSPAAVQQFPIVTSRSSR